jgi:hypothetical protein
MISSNSALPSKVVEWIKLVAEGEIDTVVTVLGWRDYSTGRYLLQHFI